MIGAANIYGMYVPWLLILAVVALGCSMLVRRLLTALGAYRWVWHPALFDLALYALLLYVVTRVSGWLQTAPPW